MSIAAINSDKFFTSIRKSLFSNNLTQSQVDGMNTIIAEWQPWCELNADLNPNIRWLAYEFATVYREAGAGMQPVREIGEGQGKEYGIRDAVTGQVYYGRGDVQLTYKTNYEKAGTALDLDLVNNPDLALQPSIAAKIMLHGMAVGLFTGRRLGTYFGANPAKDNPFGARAIINGTDHASLIATYYADFKLALS